MTEENPVKEFWNWLWNSDSWLSYIVFLTIVFIFVKFLFLPGLGLIFQTSLPLAIVESSSMEHYALKQAEGVYEICGSMQNKYSFFNSESYWQTCGSWYKTNTNITQEDFKDFPFKNGFRKGDLIIIFGKKDIQVGEVVIFNAGRNHPIIHRVISLNPIQTKGDHNNGQLSEEKSINENQIIGVAVAKIPYLGWIKLFFVELFQKLF